MNARCRDERAAAVWIRGASVLRLGTIVPSAIGAPNQEVVRADQMSLLRPGVGLRGQTLLVVELVLGPLLVKEGHEVGEEAGLQLAQIPCGQWMQFDYNGIEPDRVIIGEL